MFSTHDTLWSAYDNVIQRVQQQLMRLQAQLIQKY